MGWRHRFRSKTNGIGGTGFTLVEVLLALALIGLIASALAAGLVSASEGVRRREALAGLVGELAAARIEAMRSGQAVRVSARAEADRLVVARTGRTRSWPAAALRPVDAEDRREPARSVRGVLTVRFAPSGRADVPSWRFAVSGATSIIEVGFDAVSGAPALVREGAWDKVEEIGR